MLTEPDGLVLKFMVYTGRHDITGGKGHAQKVVLELLAGKLGQGYSVYMDSFYNSIELALLLLEQRTFSTGTLRVSRKGLPAEVITSKLKKGQSIAKYKRGVMIGKWKDKRDVTYISTEFQNSMQNVANRRGQEKEKPLPIIKYNEFMSGIDRQDQLMSYYPSQRKTVRWYKKLGVHILHLLFQNSYLLYNKYSGRKLSLYEYRQNILEKILPEKKDLRGTNKRTQHLPTKIDATNDKGKTQRKRCRVCA